MAGALNDLSGASAQNPGGYAPMMWLFALLSLAAFLCTLLLWLSDQRRGAEQGAPRVGLLKFARGAAPMWHYDAQERERQ
jgi:hypothetical protein